MLAASVGVWPNNQLNKENIPFKAEINQTRCKKHKHRANRNKHNDTSASLCAIISLRLQCYIKRLNEILYIPFRTK